MWVIFALLNPDPDSESGYGSTDLIVTGSETQNFTPFLILSICSRKGGQGALSREFAIYFAEIPLFANCIKIITLVAALDDSNLVAALEDK